MAFQSKKGCKINLKVIIIGKLKKECVPADLMKDLNFKDRMKAQKIAENETDYDSINQKLSKYY